MPTLLICLTDTAKHIYQKDRSNNEIVFVYWNILIVNLISAIF